MKRGFASLSLFTVVGCNKDIFGSTCRQRAYAYISWRSGGLFSLALSPMSHTQSHGQRFVNALPRHSRSIMVTVMSLWYTEY